MKYKTKYDWDWIESACALLAKSALANDIKFISGIPRGGLIPAVIVSHKTGIPYHPFGELKSLTDIEGVEKHNILVIDDIVDSGRTMSKLDKEYITASLVYVENKLFTPYIYYFTKYSKDWVQFPWEIDSSETIQDYLNKIDKIKNG